jgi:hypothetical protein
MFGCRGLAARKDASMVSTMVVPSVLLLGEGRASQAGGSLLALNRQTDEYYPVFTEYAIPHTVLVLPAVPAL